VNEISKTAKLVLNLPKMIMNDLIVTLSFSLAREDTEECG
jgi:hypothetical protein